MDAGSKLVVLLTFVLFLVALFVKGMEAESSGNMGRILASIDQVKGRLR
jgi:hypothetical protein